MIQALLEDPALAAILAALPHARVVGGAVRDALANRPTADIDLATPDAPATTQAALEAAGLRVIQTGLSHGTVTAISASRPFEITSLRRDVTTDGRHAEVAWTDDWQEDAARRDFTINAMSLDRSGEVYDYFGGAADLAAGHVRFVGDPATRIAEDHLRILRFFRFHARYGCGAPDALATDAIRASAAPLRNLSAERIWNELKKILAVPEPAPTITVMHELGVLRVILPEGADMLRFAALLATAAPPDPLLRLAALLAQESAKVAERLKLSNAEADRLLTLRAHPIPAADAPDDSLRRLLADEDNATLVDRTYLGGGAGAAWDDLRARLYAMPRPIFPLEGRDALALGAQPGPAIGEALRATRAAWLAAGCTGDAATWLAVLSARLGLAEGKEGQGALPPGPPLRTSP